MEGDKLMHHVYSTKYDRIWSFASSSVVQIDSPRPVPVQFNQNEITLRVVDGEPIFYAGIALTNLCNLTCKHCPVATTTIGENHLEWNLVEFENLISRLSVQGLTRVSITGGEPFMHSNILGIYRILSKYKIESKINTNGLLANVDLVNQLIPLGLVEIDVSINDPEDDTSSYANSPNYASQRVDSVTDLVKNFGDEITVTASSVLTRRLLLRLDTLALTLNQAGVKRWRLREMLPHLDSEIDSLIIPSLDEVNKILSNFAPPNGLVVYGYLLDIINGIASVRRCKNLEKHYIFISYDGNCWWMAGLSSAFLGNIKSIGAKSVSNHLQCFIDNMNPPLRCEKCPARFICGESPYL